MDRNRALLALELGKPLVPEFLHLFPCLLENGLGFLVGEPKFFFVVVGMHAGEFLEFFKDLDRSRVCEDDGEDGRVDFVVGRGDAVATQDGI